MAANSASTTIPAVHRSHRDPEPINPEAPSQHRLPVTSDRQACKAQQVLADGLTYIRFLALGRQLHGARSLPTDQNVKMLINQIPTHHFIAAGVPSTSPHLITAGGFTPSHRRILDAASAYIVELGVKTSTSQSFKVRAVFEYKSEELDDLNFPSGQIITVTDKENSDWYTGEYTTAEGDRREGLFPRSFVVKQEPAIPPRPARTPGRTTAPELASEPSVTRQELVPSRSQEPVQERKIEPHRQPSIPGDHPGVLGSVSPTLSEQAKVVAPSRNESIQKSVATRDTSPAETMAETVDETPTERALRKMDQWCDLWLNGDLKGDDWDTFKDCLDLPD